MNGLRRKNSVRREVKSNLPIVSPSRNNNGILEWDVGNMRIVRDIHDDDIVIYRSGEEVATLTIKSALDLSRRVSQDSSSENDKLWANSLSTAACYKTVRR